LVLPPGRRVDVLDRNPALNMFGGSEFRFGVILFSVTWFWVGPDGLMLFNVTFFWSDLDEI
jgi:hypothetical protein